jgi:hypothetical protein
MLAVSEKHHRIIFRGKKNRNLNFYYSTVKILFLTGSKIKKCLYDQPLLKVPLNLLIPVHTRTHTATAAIPGDINQASTSVDSIFVVTPAIAGMLANDNRKDDCNISKDDDCKSKTTPTRSSQRGKTLETEGTLTKVGTLAVEGTQSTAGETSNTSDTKEQQRRRVVE